MTPADLVAKARQFVADHPNTPYTLGGDSWTTGMDCSSFVWRVLGESKKMTDWMVANRNKYPLQEVGPGETIEPGMIAVYSGGEVNGVHKYGHTGIVADPATETIIDCSSTLDGIREHKSQVLFHGPSDGRKLYFLRYLPAYQDQPPSGPPWDGNGSGGVPLQTASLSPLVLVLLIAMVWAASREAKK